MGEIDEECAALVPANEYKRKSASKATAIQPFQNLDMRQAIKERSNRSRMTDDQQFHQSHLI